MSDHGTPPADGREQLLRRLLAARQAAEPTASPASSAAADGIPEAWTRFDRHPGYERLMVPRALADLRGLRNPYFTVHDGRAGATTRIGRRELLNFSSYNYLGLCGHPEVDAAAKQAIDRYGTSVSSSRLVAGERAPQRALEQALAALHGVEEAVVFVSGHATNVSTIACLFGPRDLIVHDALIHNSVLEGALRSGAARRSVPHNDLDALDQLLVAQRRQYERVLIVAEGLYSMDGDVPDLAGLVAIKRRHGAFLMIDEAHSLGVLGARGFGIAEHAGIDGAEVDIWMGTLSKTLASCGGYIAGSRALVEHLKYAAAGFVYSVGIAPPLTAAALAALQLMQREPQRVATLRQRSQRFTALLQAAGIDTGLGAGHAVVPVMLGNSLRAVEVSNALFARGINVQPVTYPAVGEGAARLRFFLSSTHDEAQLDEAVAALVAALAG